MTTRRRALETLGAFALTATGLASLAAPAAFAPAGSLLGFVSPAVAQTASAADLALEGPLGDIALGSKDAKVTIYEYASTTCGHCANFHVNTWPEFKKRYVDSGKVRYVMREFPLDPLAIAGFMLARCGGADKYYPMLDLLFAQQRAWTQTPRPVDELLTLARQAGFTQESFEACLKNQPIYDGVNAVKNRGADKLGVNSTPTFFINGRMERGALTLEELEKIVEPLLRG